MSYLFYRELYPDLKENLTQFKSYLKEGSKTMAPLKVWQLQGELWMCELTCAWITFVKTYSTVVCLSFCTSPHETIGQLYDYFTMF